MDFSNRNLAVLLEIGDEKIYLTQTHVSTWIIMGILIAIALIIRVLLPRFREAPGALQNIVEMAVETLSNFSKNNLGDLHKRFGSIYFGIFIFILFSVQSH